MESKLEKGSDLLLDWTKLEAVARSRAGLLPVAVQDVDSKELLLIAYANEEALRYTLAHGVAAFWSTSRDELWVKGQTSGDTLQVVEVRVNCEQNSLLYLVHMAGGGVCHTRDAAGHTRKTCYYRRIRGERLEFI